jgi:hypothetical protein
MLITTRVILTQDEGNIKKKLRFFINYLKYLIFSIFLEFYGAFGMGSVKIFLAKRPRML